MQFTLLAVGRLRPVFRARGRRVPSAASALRSDVAEVEVREAGQGRYAQRRGGGRRQPGSASAFRSRATWSCSIGRQGLVAARQLAVRLDRWRLASRPVALMLGGSHGLEPGLIHEAAEALEPRALTLPHELARVVVLEQLYRAWTILRGEPYHK